MTHSRTPAHVSGFRIRGFESQDYPSLKSIHDSLFSRHPMFLQRTVYEDSCFGRTRYRMSRLVAETGTGQIVGFGEYKHLFFGYHPQRFAVNIEVAPEWQRRGVGAALHGLLMNGLAGLGAKVATPMVLSADYQSSAGLEFATSHGYLERRRIIESALELGRLDADELERAPSELAEVGIATVDLRSEIARDPSVGSRLKDLEDSGAQDVPGAVADSPMDLHDFRIIILENPVMVWEGSFVAKTGGMYVGESSTLRTGIADTIEQGFTVVRPGFRGKGIAQAVKAKVASYAQEKGFRFIRTHNDAENAPMLSINRRMGFVKQAEWIILEKDLALA